MPDSLDTPITASERSRLIPEFESVKERWADLRLRAVYSYHDLFVGNGDREFNLSLVLVSISVAFLAVVVPLLQDYSSILFFIVMGCFSLSSILGIIDLLWTIYRDRYFFGLDQKWEDSQYRGFQDAAAAIYANLITNRPVSRRDIENYFSLKGTMNLEQERRSTKRGKSSWTKILVWLHKIFIAVFFFGFILLIAVTVLKQVNSPMGNATISASTAK